MSDNDPDLKTIVRAAIDDAYRLGIGAAIKLISQNAHQCVDPDFVDAVIVELRTLSATS